MTKKSDGFTSLFHFRFPICEKVVYTLQVGFGCGVFLNAFSLEAEQQKFCERFLHKRRAFLQRQKLPLLARESLSATKNEETKTGLERVLIFKTRALPDFDSEKVLA